MSASSNERIIVALDFPTRKAALDVVDAMLDALRLVGHLAAQLRLTRLELLVQGRCALLVIAQHARTPRCEASNWRSLPRSLAARIHRSDRREA